MEECTSSENQRVRECCHLEGETPIEIRIAYQQPRSTPARFSGVGSPSTGGGLNVGTNLGPHAGPPAKHGGGAFNDTPAFGGDGHSFGRFHGALPSNLDVSTPRPPGFTGYGAPGAGYGYGYSGLYGGGHGYSPAYSSAFGHTFGGLAGSYGGYSGYGGYNGYGGGPVSIGSTSGASGIADASMPSVPKAAERLRLVPSTSGPAAPSKCKRQSKFSAPPPTLDFEPKQHQSESPQAPDAMEDFDPDVFAAPPDSAREGDCPGRMPNPAVLQDEDYFPEIVRVTRDGTGTCRDTSRADGAASTQATTEWGALSSDATGTCAKAGDATPSSAETAVDSPSQASALSAPSGSPQLHANGSEQFPGGNPQQPQGGAPQQHQGNLPHQGGDPLQTPAESQGNLATGIATSPLASAPPPRSAGVSGHGLLAAVAAVAGVSGAAVHDNGDEDSTNSMTLEGVPSNQVSLGKL